MLSERVCLSPPGLSRGQVSFGYVGVKLDSQARLVFDGEVAVLPEWAFMGDEVGPPVDPFCEFVDAEAAHGCGSMGRGNGADGTCRIVSRCPDLPHVCEIGYAF